MRRITIAGEKWWWAVRKEPDYSEYTPCNLRTMTLQGPDGYRRSFTLDYDTSPVTPSKVANIIREKKATWPCV